MSRHRILQTCLAIGLCSSPALRAQSALPRDPQRGSSPVENSFHLDAFRLMTANTLQNVQRLSTLSPQRQLTLQGPAIARMATSTATPSEQHLECPMPVLKDMVVRDSMPVGRVPSQGIASMPIIALLCENPLGAKH
jgi:hypothetical protein